MQQLHQLIILILNLSQLLKQLYLPGLQYLKPIPQDIHLILTTIILS